MINLQEKKGEILKDPPQTLILQRKAIQTFLGSQKVVLYYCPTLKRYFSFTYGKDGIELMESDFSIIEKLKNINNVETLYFNNGTSINIDKECSNHILELYSELSEGKCDFEEFILESDKNFLDILEYSVNKFKQETK